MSIPVPRIGASPVELMSGYHRGPCSTVADIQPCVPPARRCRTAAPAVADRRFEGAITRPAEHDEPFDASIEPVPGRPPRPLLLEFASAMLIVGAITSILGVLGARHPAAGPIDLILIGLAALTGIVGLLVRAGRAWILDLNVVAIVLFLEMTSLPSAVAVVFSILDAIVLFALIRHRPWFDWKTTTDDHVPSGPVR
jgi:hypothetical protein